ncbi:MAG TPA: wax ester/triacylglycerol synthase family O-acyltransferase [Terriglobales bacterium]|nr:wax ester/triacylglycerol synthase family O-acyltransferase [Terriglobales bacterium]
MPESQPSNSFSWGDALFLYIERPGQPLHIACVSVFDGPIPLKACRDFVESRLPLVPRYKQRVAFPPFNIGLPSWQFDPNFDIRNHIRQVTLRKGSERELKALASKIFSASLERNKPLWDITLVRGLEGNRTGMIARIHHCLADGISGVGIMNVLMDPSPVPPAIPRKKTTKPAAPTRDAGAQLLDSLMKSYFSAVKGALMLHGEALKIAEGLVGSPEGGLNDLMNVVPEIASPAERLPFNVVCHGPQKFGWTEIPMADIQAIRQLQGGTVNDVILTVIAAALRRYAELRGVRVKGRSVRIMIPVNVRANGEAKELGNRISFLPVTIPLDIRSPQKLFAFVRERMEYLKRARAAEFVGFAGGLFSAIPTPIWAAIGPVASQLPLSLCNIICTNVPGPPMPLYLLGRKMLSWYPYVPIGGEMGVNCAILSYNGTAYFGFTCDVNAVPDPEHLEKFVEMSCEELRKMGKAAPVKPEKAEKRTAKPRRKRAKATIPVDAKPSPRQAEAVAVQSVETVPSNKKASEAQTEVLLAVAGD